MHVLEQAAPALEELRGALEAVNHESFDGLVEELANAKTIVTHGLGREGLMMRALAMRLFHMGVDVHVAGDMTTPPVGKGDLLFVSVGPGELETTHAMVRIAKQAGARVACVTAVPGGSLPRDCDRVLVIPAQTMANDQGGRVSVLPMGSLFEGAQFMVFEFIVLALRDRLGETAESMRARHTNLE